MRERVCVKECVLCVLGAGDVARRDMEGLLVTSLESMGTACPLTPVCTYC